MGETDEGLLSGRELSINLVKACLIIFLKHSYATWHRVIKFGSHPGSKPSSVTAYEDSKGFYFNSGNTINFKFYDTASVPPSPESLGEGLGEKHFLIL